MSIYKRGGVYWFHFEFDDRHIQKSTKQGNPRVARQIEAAYRTKLAKGEVGIHEPKPVPTFDKAIKEFLAWSETEHAAPRTHISDMRQVVRCSSDFSEARGWMRSHPTLSRSLRLPA